MDEMKTTNDVDIDWDAEVARLLEQLRIELPQAKRERTVELLKQAIEKANSAAWNRGIEQARSWAAEDADDDDDYDRDYDDRYDDEDWR